MIIKTLNAVATWKFPVDLLLNWDDQKLVNQVFTEIRLSPKKHRCVFVRLRPQLKNTSENMLKLRKAGTKDAPMHLHAEHTVILDLSKSEDELLKDMRRQTLDMRFVVV